MTFTIEPMINEGGWELGRIWPDGWTAPTRDGSRSAQFEHTLLVTPTGVEVCTLLAGRAARQLSARSAMRMEGEQALVTGSTAGIGRAIAVAFGREGAGVVVTGRDRERGDAVVARDRRRGRHRALHRGRPARRSARAPRSSTTRRRARRARPCSSTTRPAAARTDGAGRRPRPPTRGTRSCASTSPRRCGARAPRSRTCARAGHGAIVNISSRQAERASPGLAAYVAAKAGHERPDARDRGRRSRRTASAATRSAPATCSTTGATPTSRAERRARYEGMHLTRLGVADDVAHAAVYLASRESEFVTGINLQLDGGSSIARGLTLG